LAWVIIAYHWIWKRKICLNNIALGQISIQNVTNGCEKSPDIFQRIMYELLGDIPSIQVYLDDILITSNVTFEEHADIMETVLERLRKSNFRANLKKMLFWRIQN
jgi:hypothetical protein